MKLKKFEDSNEAWNYIFIFNAGISLIAGNFLYHGDIRTITFTPFLRNNFHNFCSNETI